MRYDIEKISGSFRSRLDVSGYFFISIYRFYLGLVMLGWTCRFIFFVNRIVFRSFSSLSLILRIVFVLNKCLKICDV